MQKYFYSDGTNSYGPFTLEELTEKNITRETMVWFQELGEWKPAGSVPELSEMFVLTPPPVAKPVAQNPFQDNFNHHVPPKNYLLESILVTLFCCLPFGIAGIVNASKVESLHYSGDVVGAKRAADEAKKWTMIGLFSGIAVIIIYFGFIFISFAVRGRNF